MSLNTAHAHAHHSLRVQVGTFNYNLRGSADYDTPDLQPWLVPTVEEDPDSGYATDGHGPRDAPDIYAVGFQELMPLHMGFAGTGSLWSAHTNNNADDLYGAAAQVLADTDTEIRRAVRPHAAITSGNGLYPQDGGPEGYTLLAQEHLVGIALFVYARDRSGIPARVKEIRTNRAGTGFFGLLGNKGAVGIRVVLDGQQNLRGTGQSEADQVLTFVCGHLAAHDHNIARRNADWKHIVQRLVFPPDSIIGLPLVDEPPRSRRGHANPADLAKLQNEYTAGDDKTVSIKKGGKRRQAKALDRETHTLYDSSHLFVCGDLNYRIAVGVPPHKELAAGSGLGNKPLKKNEVGFKVAMEQWDTLAPYDQLSIERLGGRVFHGLTESPLSNARFGPTYKYKVDKSAKKKKRSSSSTGAGAPKKKKAGLADVGVLSKKRIPGWTDRILWRSWADGKDELPPKSAGQVDVELYRSVMTYTHSDHKPVTAILRLPPQPVAERDASAPLIGYTPPYTTDSAWRQKRAIGTLLDRLVGTVWTALITAGAGNLIAGIAELVVVAILSAWWLSRGGGSGNDLSYWLGRMSARP